MTGISRRDLSLGQGHAPLSIFTAQGAPGPVLAVIGAIHGDEYEGPLVLSRLLAALPGMALTGSLILVPLANPDAAAAGTRVSRQDGKNLARMFPGDAAGSYTQRLADLLHRHVIAPADAVLDLHSGGAALDSVFFAGYADDPDGVGARAGALARAFGADMVWRHDPPLAPGRSMSSASDLGKPGVYVECSGGPFPPARMVQAYHDGVLRVMAALGMIAAVPAGGQPRVVTGSGDLDTTGPAPATGLCTAHVAVGATVSRGQPLFTITGLDGQVLAKVQSPGDGIVMFARRAAWVETGETLLALAVPDPA